MGLFIQNSFDDKQGNAVVEDLLIDNALKLIECGRDEMKLDLSKDFWRHYEKIKEHRQKFHTAKNEVSLEIKAMNNLKSALKLYKSELESYLPFIRDLIKDLRSYHTISKYSLRRIANIDLCPDKPKELSRFIKEIEWLKNNLGPDYLDIVKRKVQDNKDEIIIAVENVI